MAIGTYRQLYYVVLAVTLAFCVYWGSGAIPAAYATDGRSGALLMMLVLFSVFALVALFGFIVLELSEELAAGGKRTEGAVHGVKEDTNQKKVS